jgi:DNA-binding GntR family transcriptional regulator
MTAAPIHPVTTVAALEQALEDRILDGDLAPGSHLREADLAADYDVARHSLRAACDALARRGLLTKRVNRGFFVPELTKRDAEEIFELRRALELPIVRDLAAARTVPALTLQALAAFEAMPRDAAWRDIVRTDVDFHRGLVEAAGNSRIVRAHSDLLSEIALCIVQTGSAYDDAREVAREHRELADAIRSGSADAAEWELAAHFEEGLKRLPFPEPR